MQTPLVSILVSYTLKSSSWNNEVSTIANAHQILLLPEKPSMDDYIKSVDFHNRALHHIASKQYGNDESNSCFIITDENNVDQNITVFLEHEKDGVLKSNNELNLEINLIQKNSAEYYEEYKDEHGKVQITIDIGIYNIRQINNTEFKFMDSILTPVEHLLLTPIYALK